MGFDDGGLEGPSLASAVGCDDGMVVSVGTIDGMPEGLFEVAVGRPDGINVVVG